jgi:hypothetical protein
MEAKEEFWEWIGQRLDNKREELKEYPDGHNRYLLKTEITEAEVIVDNFAKLFGYPLGR